MVVFIVRQRQQANMVWVSYGDAPFTPYVNQFVTLMVVVSCKQGYVTRLRSVLPSFFPCNLSSESPLTENRFGLVGFGGASSNNEAHIETIKGELFGTMESFILRLEDLQYDSEGMGDVWGAIDMAMGYPFRPGVPKHIVLLSCSKCTERSRSVSHLSDVPLISTWCQTFVLPVL